LATEDRFLDSLLLKGVVLREEWLLILSRSCLLALDLEPLRSRMPLLSGD
jgi:hypothetical protein